MGYRLIALSALFLLLLSPHSEASQWEEMTLPHFVIKYDTRDKHYAVELYVKLEGIRGKIISDIGEVNIPRIRVYVVPSHDRMLTLQPPGSDVPPWAAAAAFSRENLILIRSPRLLKGKKKDILRTATHEVSHVLLGGAVGHNFRLPRWLNEGFAMYQAGEWNFLDATSMMWASVSGSFFTLEELDVGFPEKAQEARIAYLQSISVVAYLLDSYGREAFISLIRNLREQKNLNYSLKLTYGITLKQLEKRWLKKIRITYSWIPIGTSVSALWFVFTWLLVAGYIRKRSATKKKLRQWEAEESEGRWMDFE